MGAPLLPASAPPLNATDPLDAGRVVLDSGGVIGSAAGPFSSPEDLGGDIAVTARSEAPLMTTARASRGFRFPAEVILWAVRWYLQVPISYRDLELMLADWGVEVNHVTHYH